MSLRALDTKLSNLAKSLNGELTKDNFKSMFVPDRYEERTRWQKDELNYLIQIYPEIKNGNIHKWVFWSCCSFDTEKSRYLKKSTVKDCSKQIEIISKFDELVERALKFLDGLAKDDLEKVIDFD